MNLKIRLESVQALVCSLFGFVMMSTADAGDDGISQGAVAEQDGKHRAALELD